MKATPNTTQLLIIRTLFFITSSLLLLLGQAAAQGSAFYLLTSEGGEGGLGTISRYSPAAQSLSAAHHFERNTTTGPGKNNGFIQCRNGRLYALTANAIIQFDPQTGHFTQLHDFTLATGINPTASLVEGGDGLLYGMTTGGGAHNAGVLFSYDPTQRVYKKLVEFDGLNGAQPVGRLLFAADGRLYGTTSQGGMYNQGVLFSYDPTSRNFSKLYEWSGPDGSTPQGGLVQTAAGLLVAMTQYGGADNRGVIYSYHPQTGAYTNLLAFDGSNGSYPSGHLLQAADGHLYGLTPFGGANETGVLFSFNLQTGTYTKYFDFTGTPNAGLPFGSLTQGKDGRLYGTAATPERGFSYGTLFSFDISNKQLRQLHQFQPTEGALIYGTLLPAADGKLYGMAGAGGSTYCCISSKGAGSIYSFDPATGKLDVKLSFNTGASGFAGTLSSGPGGMLYGFSSAGGSYRNPANMKGTGTLFSFDPASGNTRKLADYGENNATPVGGLLHATDGLLYGVTLTGGNYGQGTLYSFDVHTARFTIRHHFGYGEGVYPQGMLIQARDGKLYGTTTYGGASNSGTLFSYDPVSGAFSSLAQFGPESGDYPMGALMQAPDGRLYGLCNFGGAKGFGTLYSYDPAIDTLSAVHHFTGTGGAFPYGGLTVGQDGSLYGLTSAGGQHGGGVLFAYTMHNKTFAPLFQFSEQQGQAPKGTLLAAGNGLLYGATSSGGSKGKGVLFSFDPGNSNYTRLQDFDGANGAAPLYTTLVAVADCAPLTVKIPDATALPKGAAKNTVYLGYAPAAALNLSVSGAGEDASYRYQWSNGATASSITVNPQKNTTYTVAITDAFGCTHNATREVMVKDVRCGPQMNKVVVCEPGSKNKSVCIEEREVAAKLANGAQLGACSGAPASSGLQVIASPNPTTTSFNLRINDTGNGGKIMVRVLDLFGRVLEQHMLHKSGTLQLGAHYRPGIYVAQVYQDGKKEEVRLIKLAH